MKFSFGIEHEVAFLNERGRFADFSCTQFQDFERIIEKLPIYQDDYRQLRLGDAGIKIKRWYIEGLERFADSDEVIDYVPKGIEIRTTIHGDIQSAIAELTESFNLLRQIAAQFNFTPVLVSFNPYHALFEPHPPLNDYELKRRQISPEKQTESIPMLTYGPDLNISSPGLSTEHLIDLGRKLTYYSPSIVPFSFSSPFYKGDLWGGLSIRTFVRTGARPATMVFLEKREDLIKSTPSLTKVARIPAEVGRIEFKAFDSCDDFRLYGALLALLKGIILDESLPGRITIPDPEMHQLSASQGFHHPDIFSEATKVLQAAEVALKDDLDVGLLSHLKESLSQRKTPADRLIDEFKSSGSIAGALQQTYIMSGLDA
jgi:hypothetical protein